MDITAELIKTFATSFTASELATMKQQAMNALIAGSERIVSASTGAGASYTKELNYAPQDLLELIGYAEQYQQTGHLPTGGQIYTPIAFYPINH